MTLDDIFVSEYYYLPFILFCIVLLCLSCCIIHYCIDKYKNKYKLPKYTNLPHFLNYHKKLNSSCKIYPITVSNDCFICFHTPELESFITLDCKHSIHSHCVINWWKSQPSAFASCPLCRHVSNICFLEVKHSNPNEFVGFYRNDNNNKTFIRLNYTQPTNFIAIKDKAKKHAQDMCIYIYQQAPFFTRSILFTQ